MNYITQINHAYNGKYIPKGSVLHFLPGRPLYRVYFSNRTQYVDLPSELVDDNSDMFKPVLDVCEVGNWVSIVDNYHHVIGIGRVKSIIAVKTDTFNYRDIIFSEVYGDELVAINFTCNIKFIHETTGDFVEKYLIKEAEKRGFKPGVNLPNVLCYYKSNKTYPIFYTNDKLWLRTTDNNFQACFGGGLYTQIYDSGIWAKIEESEKAKVTNIQDYEVQKVGNKIQFKRVIPSLNCIKEQFNQIIKFNDFEKYCGYSETPLNCKIKSVTFDSGLTLTIEQIKELINN